MAKDKAIWVEGERELFANMQKSMGGTFRSAREGLQKAGLSIIAEAVRTIRKEKIWTTGQLASSGKCQAVQGDEDALDVGFFSEGTEGYAFFVEYGRRAGKMPPSSKLAAWAYKKIRQVERGDGKMGKMTWKEAEGIGFAIARKIGRKGTKPHPFFRPAVEKNEKKIVKAIQEAVKESLK